MTMAYTVSEGSSSPDHMHNLLHRLENVKRAAGGWVARCPGHDDRVQSLKIDLARDDERILLFCHAGCETQSILDALGMSMSDLFSSESSQSGPKIVPLAQKIDTTYDYHDENGDLVLQVVRYIPKSFRQRRPDGNGGWIWNVSGVNPPLYRLPNLLSTDKKKFVFVCAGEKDADRLDSIGLIATTNPMGEGKGKWKSHHTESLRGRNAVILCDNDKTGLDRGEEVARALSGVAAKVRVIHFPELPDHGDVSDWLDQGNDREALIALVRSTPEWVDRKPETALSIEDFLSYLPEAKYIHGPTGTIWDTSGINRSFPPVMIGKVAIKQSSIIDDERPVHQLTWIPGEPKVMIDVAMVDGGKIAQPGHRVFNQYRPPTVRLGRASEAERWIDLLETVYPDDAVHIASWLAHRVQRPAEKCNHALVLGGQPGIGKDTIIQGVTAAIGAWNIGEASPDVLAGRFNSFLKSVILRVSELRDTGDTDRYSFYEHCKTIIAAPPDTLLVDEKHIRAYRVPNVTGVIFTTNHRTNGLYLPADDRRHYIAWSELSQDHFTPAFWESFYSWLERENGYGHVAAYLREFDLSDFNPKAAPPKTTAFWDIVNANQAPEAGPMTDAIESLGNPNALTVKDIIAVCRDQELNWFLEQRKNARQIPYRFEEVGYIAVRNPAAKDGLWVIGQKRQVVYAKAQLSIRDRIESAQKRANRPL